MNEISFRIKPFGTRAVLLEWPAEVHTDILEDIVGFVEFLQAGPMPVSQWEFVPVYHSLTLISKSADLDYPSLKEQLEQAYSEYPGPVAREQHHWELPVCYDAAFGPDLETAAAALGMSPEALIEAHTAQPYPVYGIGFLPGFLYLGGIPEAIQVPRREAPRPKVPKGAVGLASRQTGIYPQESPGGWNLIGNCPIPLFDPKREPPCFVSLGDTVRFRSVSRAEYDLHKIEGEVGVYDFKRKYGNAKG